MEGEYLSLREIHSYMPDFVPKPIAWGKYKHCPPNTYFFLMDFVDLDPSLPSAASSLSCIESVFLLPESLDFLKPPTMALIHKTLPGIVTGAPTSPGFSLNSLTER